MDDIYTSELVSLGVSLTELAVKGTSTAVSNKIKAIKEEKASDKIRATYDEIVNELLAESDDSCQSGTTFLFLPDNVPEIYGQHS